MNERVSEWTCVQLWAAGMRKRGVLREVSRWRLGAGGLRVAGAGGTRCRAGLPLSPALFTLPKVSGAHHVLQNPSSKRGDCMTKF